MPFCFIAEEGFEPTIFDHPAFCEIYRTLSNLLYMPGTFALILDVPLKNVIKRTAHFCPCEEQQNELSPKPFKGYIMIVPQKCSMPELIYEWHYVTKH